MIQNGCLPLALTDVKYELEFLERSNVESNDDETHHGHKEDIFLRVRQSLKHNGFNHMI